MHNTHNHKCDTCESNQICLHIDLKYANCDKKHHAKDASCEVYFALKSNEEISINCMFSTSNSSNFEMQKNFESAKLRILQHNCNRSTNVMQTILEYAVKNANIVLLQES